MQFQPLLQLEYIHLLDCCNAALAFFRLSVLIMVISVAFIAWLFILLLTFCLREAEILCVGYVLYLTLIRYLLSARMA